MTPQEHQALQQLLSQLTQIRGIPKDPDADRMIAGAVAQQPDAAYLLVQRAMLLEQALEAAKEQIRQLESRLTPPSAAAGRSSFLDAGAWGNTVGRSSPAQEISATGRPLSATPMPPAGSAPSMASGFGRTTRPGFFGGGSGSSMLGTLAATAAGVAGGAFLFHGIGNLLNNEQDAAQASNEPAPDQPLAQDEAGNDAQLSDSSFEDNSFADGGFSGDGGLGDGSFEV